MLAATQRCSVHEQRPAFARCMSCAKMLCQECATQWDGIWHCASCLALKRGAAVRRSPVFSWIAVVTLSLFLLFAGARVMVWTAAILAELF
ncbi:MAG: B-box zinc finger protein [Thermoanaerobaculia bacterium]